MKSTTNMNKQQRLIVWKQSLRDTVETISLKTKENKQDTGTGQHRLKTEQNKKGWNPENPNELRRMLVKRLSSVGEFQQNTS